MLPSIGISEMLLIAMLLIIVVGPKDMPKMMRTLGQYIRKIKMIGQEFKEAFDDMGRELEITELRKEIEDLKSMGRLSNLTDEAFNEDLLEYDTELRESVMREHPRAAKPSADGAPKEGGDNGAS